MSRAHLVSIHIQTVTQKREKIIKYYLKLTSIFREHLTVNAYGVLSSAEQIGGDAPIVAVVSRLQVADAESQCCWTVNLFILFGQVLVWRQYRHSACRHCLATKYWHRRLRAASETVLYEFYGRAVGGPSGPVVGGRWNGGNKAFENDLTTALLSYSSVW